LTKFALSGKQRMAFLAAKFFGAYKNNRFKSVQFLAQVKELYILICSHLFI